MKKTILFIIISTTLLAQSADLDFKHFTTTDGLVTNWLHFCPIVQDDLGFIWIGSDHGLHRYDGYNFIVFTRDEKDTTTLSASNIRSLYKDSKGRIWIGTIAGLNLWKPETESFIRYNNTSAPDSGKSITWIEGELKSGQLVGWGDNELLSFDPETGRTTSQKQVIHQINGLGKEGRGGSYLDKDDILWLSSSDGLIKYNFETRQLKFFSAHNAKYSNPSLNPIGSEIYEDLSGRLLLGAENTFYYFDRKTETFQNLHKLKKSDIRLLKAVSQAGGVSIIHQSPVTNEYWIVTELDGIKRFDSTGTLISNHTGNFSRIFEDKSGIIWLGTGDEGIYKSVLSPDNFKPKAYGFNELNRLEGQHVLSIIEDNTDNLWIGTFSQILYKYNMKTKKLKKYTHDDNKGLGRGMVNCLFMDSKNRIWIGTIQGLNLYHPDSDSFTISYADPHGTADENFIVYIEEDSAGNLTLGTYTNSRIMYYSFRYNEQTGEATFVLNPDYDSSLILKNNGGRIKKISGSESRYIPFPFTMHSIIEDKNGMVWIGASEGLLKYNPINRKYKLFTTQNGLPVNTTGGILKDDDGFLWVANSAGLLKVNPDGDSFIHFGKEDGLTNNLFEEYKAVCKLKTGLLLFGGFDGVTVIDPKRFKPSPVKPDVHLTGLKIYGQTVPISEDGILKQSITTAKSIELEFNQNDISIDYVGLHYKNPQKNRYAYKLEPYQEEWVDAGSFRNAHYTNLAPGKYTFHVKAANSDGIWNESGKRLSIIIHPPIWATWWAYGIYIILGLGLLYTIRRFELNRRLEKENKRLLELENKRKTKELEEARQLQLSMLPKQLPQLPNLDIAVYMKTATEVGGDYYDFHVSMNGTLTVVIGDATGHGMKAGTMVTAAKSLFNSYASNPDILYSFREITRCIKQMNMDKMSMCMTMLKIQDSRLQMSSAGMPPLFIFRQDTRIVEEHLMEGMPLGTMNKFPYKTMDTKLQPGDTILLLSDGLPELQNDNEKLFGYERVRNIFEEIAEKNPEEIVNHLKDDGSTWIKDRETDDDVTFVVIKVKK